MNSLPNCIRRISDGALLLLNDDKITYSFDKSQIQHPYKYNFDTLISYKGVFETVENWGSTRVENPKPTPPCNSLYHWWDSFDKLWYCIVWPNQLTILCWDNGKWDKAITGGTALIRRLKENE